MLITSNSNERVKHARRVREGRERELIFVEGERLAAECIASGLTLHTCFTTDAVPPAGITCPAFQLTESVLDSLSDTMNSQGIILIATRPQPNFDSIFAKKNPLILGLDRVQDPGNLGTLIRTAEAAGASGILSFAGSADAYAPKTLRSAMGSAFRLPIVAEVFGLGAIAACRAKGIRTVVATGEGDTPHYDYDWSQPTLLILGNEAHGATADLLTACDSCLRIPLHAPVESLNVSAAGAAMLFEAVRQRAK
jgi:TrmH family RNA methyltransferase